MVQPFLLATYLLSQRLFEFINFLPCIVEVNFCFSVGKRCLGALLSKFFIFLRGPASLSFQLLDFKLKSSDYLHYLISFMLA